MSRDQVGKGHSLSKGTELRNSLMCAKKLQAVCCGWNVKFEGDSNGI